MADLRTELLAAAKPYFERFVARRRGDPKWERELAMAVARLATVSQLLDPPDVARDNWREAIRNWEDILRKNPGADATRFELAMALSSLGYQEFRGQRFADAERTITACLGHLRAIADRSAHGYFAVSTESRNLAYLANIVARRDAGRATELHEEAVRIQGEAVRRFPTVLARLDLGVVQFLRGRTLVEAGEFDAAVPHLEAAGKIFEVIAATPCREQEPARRDMASAASALGVAWAGCRKVPREVAAANAERVLASARGLWTGLCNRHPTVLDYQTSLAETLQALADLYLDTNRPDDAEKAALAALDRREKLRPLHPANPVLAADVCDSYDQLARVAQARLRAAGSDADMERHAADIALWLGKAVDLMADQHKAGTLHPRLVGRIATLSSTRARVLGDLGKPTEADAEWRRAIRFAAPGQREAFEKERLAAAPE